MPNSRHFSLNPDLISISVQLSASTLPHRTVAAPTCETVHLIPAFRAAQSERDAAQGGARVEQSVGHSLVEVTATRPELYKLPEHYQRALRDDSVVVDGACVEHRDGAG